MPTVRIRLNGTGSLEEALLGSTSRVALREETVAALVDEIASDTRSHGTV